MIVPAVWALPRKPLWIGPLHSLSENCEEEELIICEGVVSGSAVYRIVALPHIRFLHN